MASTPNSTTVILQSHRSPEPSPWLGRCMASVREWAAESGCDYKFSEDELFDHLPADIATKLLGGDTRHVVVATDLARLYWLQHELENGAETVLWLDADTLVFDPCSFVLPADSFAVGREVWVQHDDAGKLRSYKKVHNAFLLFRQDNPFLSYYIHAAEQTLRAYSAPYMVPQLVGPKFLTALHNVVACPVAESAVMLSPLVVGDILQGGGEALALFNRKSPSPPAAANLCGSSVAGGELSELQMLALIEQLLAAPGHYFQ